ncbi:E3 ubiquitin-protein ligase NEURL3 [Merluccius polli]|uniref:E3 ubiquitin-protein ligase NEURL3 n=1 Tax=Merluccius polli TaxID=89951 RepID=A0AA47MWD2_MERPO|nr:E3 ubiquitin-protein ligase NEURL3 [Merluccius polli]
MLYHPHLGRPRASVFPGPSLRSSSISCLQLFVDREHMPQYETLCSPACIILTCTWVLEMGRHVKSALQGKGHCCGCSCLGPLAFHSAAVGGHISLSWERTLARRKECTFNNGLVFSSRPVRVGEVVSLQVKKQVGRWSGALRLGFTNVAPSSRSLPLPPMAIPDLTDTAGHWAQVVPEPFCYVGSILESWVSHGGNVYCRMMNHKRHKLVEGVDLSKPLWAMLDIYGQTGAVLLLGSQKRKALFSRKSCPLPSPYVSMQSHHYGLDGREVTDLDDLCTNDKNCVCYLRKKVCSDLEACVACLDEPATNTLLCGHRCLCHVCTVRVIQEFGTCPLCRHAI